MKNFSTKFSLVPCYDAIVDTFSSSFVYIIETLSAINQWQLYYCVIRLILDKQLNNFTMDLRNQITAYKSEWSNCAPSKLLWKVQKKNQANNSASILHLWVLKQQWLWTDIET